VTTMAGSIAGALVVVIAAGMATDYLLAEVQFWLFASLVSAIQLIEKARETALPDASRAGPGAVHSGHAATSVRT